MELAAGWRKATPSIRPNLSLVGVVVLAVSIIIVVAFPLLHSSTPPQKRKEKKGMPYAPPLPGPACENVCGS